MADQFDFFSISKMPFSATRSYERNKGLSAFSVDQAKVATRQHRQEATAQFAEPVPVGCLREHGVVQHMSGHSISSRFRLIEELEAVRFAEVEGEKAPQLKADHTDFAKMFARLLVGWRPSPLGWMPLLVG